MSLLLNKENKIILNTEKVKLKPYVARPFLKYELMSDQELLAGSGGTMMVDTECYPNFFLISFKDIKTKKIIKFIPPFDERKLSWIMHNYKTVGFNSFKYDLCMIWAAYQNQDTEHLKKVSNAIINQNMWRNEVEKEFGFKIHPTNTIDLIEVCPLKGSLKLYGARLHAPRIQDLPIPDTKYLTEEEKEIVENYCINDLDTTELLFDNLTEQLKLREQLSIEYKIDLMSKSDAQIAEAVIGSELKRLTGKWPSKPKIQSADIHKFVAPTNMFFQTEQMKKVLATIQNADFGISFEGRLEAPKEIKNLKISIGNSVYRMGIGGLHSSEENFSIKADNEFELVDIDAESFYPKIVLNCGLFPKHIGENFLTVYKMIVERRIAAKKAKNLAVSENLKVTINGTFGKTGSPYSILYAPEMTIQITVGGQLYLLMLIEQLELQGIPVVSANTDGILIKCPKDKKYLMKETVKVWEKITGFTTEETKYEAVYFRDVNAYLAIKTDKETKGKNVYYNPWNGKSAKDKYWRFQKNPTAQICIEAIEKLIVENKSIEETIKNCKDITKFVCVKNVTGGAHKDGNYLGKVVRWIFIKNELGTINYINSNNKVPDSEGGLPVMDLPPSLPNNLNYDVYIKRATDLLYDMNYYEKEKQIAFF